MVTITAEDGLTVMKFGKIIESKADISAMDHGGMDLDYEGITGRRLKILCYYHRHEVKPHEKDSP